MRLTRRACLTLLGASASALPGSLARAAQRPFLVIGGRTRSGVEERWSREDLASVGAATLETSTPWHREVQRFEGVRLGALLERVGAGDAAGVTLHALNDYTATVPTDDVRRYDPLLALRRNGVEMPVSDKGPVFLVYPFDRHAELDEPVHRARSVWQVDALVIV